MPDQRENTRLLTDDELAKVQRLLALPQIKPQTSAGQQQLPSWKGTDDKDWRGGLITELTDALGERLAQDYQEAQRKKALPTVDLSILEAAGDAAKQAVNEVFAAWTAQAALTKSVADQRKAHVFTASGSAPNILDIANRKQREAGGKPVNGRDVAKYLAVNDPECRKVMAKYSFNPYSGTKDETNCLSNEVLDPFCKLHQNDLDECDRLGFWMANPDLGVVFAPRYLDNWQASDGYNVPVVWDLKGRAYLKLIHEYIHTLQHPIVPLATGGSNTIKEGVCEYLTLKVLRHLMGKTDGEFDEIAANVEGSRTDGRGAALRARIRKYRAAADYAHLVENVSDAITVMGGAITVVGGDNGLLAAFFQGHTEYIGRYFTANWLDGERELPGGARTMPTPEAFETIDSLVKATMLDGSTIMRDNQIGPTDDFPRHIYLRGFHVHLMIVDSSDNQEAWENWDMIAAQHNVTADRIQEANGSPAEMPVKRWILVPDA